MNKKILYLQKILKISSETEIKFAKLISKTLNEQTSENWEVKIGTLPPPPNITKMPISDFLSIFSGCKPMVKNGKKRILHLQIPVEERGLMKDCILVSPEEMGKILQSIKDNLDKNGWFGWIVMSSPMLPSVSEDFENFFNFDMSEISKDKLFELAGINE